MPAGNTPCNGNTRFTAPWPMLRLQANGSGQPWANATFSFEIVRLSRGWAAEGVELSSSHREQVNHDTI